MNRTTVRIDDLVTSGEAAQRLGVARSALAMWRARYPDFPVPILAADKIVVYAWSEVERWSKRRPPRSVVRDQRGERTER